MSGPTSGDEPRGMNMNSIDYYQAEIAYRREQMLRDRAPMRRFRRALRIATASAPRNHTR
jgi:hypothetical protein